MKSSILSLAAALALASSAAAHVSIINPCPRYSPVGENCPALPAGESLDTGEHAINGPINSVQLGGTMPLCRHTTPYATPSATWTAGQSVTIKFNPSAAIHSGGNCEFSMSYDNGKTFAVIHQELRYCFLGSKPASLTNTATILSYTFNLPADLPSSDKAVFAWSWVNASGNREFYMNCADVAIKGSTSTSYTGKEMTIANYPGYPTIPEFNGNYETGMEYYTGAKNITVSPGGTSNPAPAPSSAKPSYSASSAPAPVSSAPAYTKTAPQTKTAVATSAGTPVGHTPSATSAPATAPATVPAPATSDDTESCDSYDDDEETTTAAPAPSATGSSPAPAPSSAGQPSGDGVGQSCSGSELRCAPSGSGYQYCLYGAWSPVYACSDGTKCKASGNSILCDWA